MIYQNILEAIGGTPMVQLSRMTGPEHARILVKYEGLNVGGSIKTLSLIHIFSSLIQTVTVGFGISPNQPHKRVADYTAGRDLHPAPKNLFC